MNNSDSVINSLYHPELNVFLCGFKVLTLNLGEDFSPSSSVLTSYLFCSSAGADRHQWRWGGRGSPGAAGGRRGARSKPAGTILHLRCCTQAANLGRLWKCSWCSLLIQAQFDQEEAHSRHQHHHHHHHLLHQQQQSHQRVRRTFLPVNKVNS